MIPLNEIIIAVKGAGEMASAVAWRLYMSNFKNILMLETDYPLAVRREVSFCEAVHEGEKEVEQVRALRVQQPDEIEPCWQKNAIAVAVDPQWQTLRAIQPEVIVDAVLAINNVQLTLVTDPGHPHPGHAAHSEQKPVPGTA